MYTVQYCTPDGNLRERKVRTLEDAILEKAYLEERYDGVQVLDQNGNVIEL